MLYNKHDAKTYEKEFMKRFTNFSDKSPMLISFSVTPTCVQIVDENTDTVYEFKWDYTLSVKEFIHIIKEKLSQACYPEIIKTIKEEVALSSLEQAKLLENGTDIDKIPLTKTLLNKKVYIIDKVIIYKDIFILKEKETGKLSRYQLNKSAVLFLKKMRSGSISKEDAGNFFFENSNHLNDIET
jgi:hypothetical protein